MSGRMLKYSISIVNQTTALRLAVGTVVRAVGVQEPGNVVLWAEVPVGVHRPVETRTFTIIGTGHDVPETGTYIGTVFDGPFVWHVYEVTT